MGASLCRRRVRGSTHEAREPLVAGGEHSTDCLDRCRKRLRLSPTDQDGSNGVSNPEVSLVPVSPHWVVWISIDPRSGQIAAYPKEVSQLLELALRRGDAMVNLGSSFFGATVELGAGSAEQGAFQQRTARGGRDVRRMLLQRADEPITLWVRQGRHRWSAVDPSEGGDLEERTVSLPEDALELSKVEEERQRERPPPDEREGVALWQWCQELHVTPAEAEHLQDCFWGIYTEEQNRQIEEAYQAAERQVGIVVGVREYQVVFGPQPNFARQEDQRLRKRRLMRRKWLSEEEYRRRMTQDMPASTEREQEECILCLFDFAETAHMPVIELPVCKHVFHRACAQQLMDARDRCPCCRAEVDWSFLR